MDNIADKLTELLNNPEGMEKIKKMADSLLSDSKTEEKNESSGFDIDPSALMGVISALNHSAPDNRASLLLALKPHLSDERQHRVDSAVKLLKLASLLPLVKQFI